MTIVQFILPKTVADDCKAPSSRKYLCEHDIFVHMWTWHMRVQSVDDWRYVAMVIDRLQLYIFLAVTVGGSIAIFINSPHVYDLSASVVYNDDDTKSRITGSCPIGALWRRRYMTTTGGMRMCAMRRFRSRRTGTVGVCGIDVSFSDGIRYGF